MGFFPQLKVNRCEEQSFKCARAGGGEWDARENECFCAELAGVLCMITEVVFLVCYGRDGGRKLKPLIRIQNVTLFPCWKFSSILLMTSVKPGSHAENLDGSVTLW